MLAATEGLWFQLLNGKLMIPILFRSPPIEHEAFGYEGSYATTNGKTEVMPHAVTADLGNDGGDTVV